MPEQTSNGRPGDVKGRKEREAPAGQQGIDRGVEAESPLLDQAPPNSRQISRSTRPGKPSTVFARRSLARSGLAVSLDPVEGALLDRRHDRASDPMLPESGQLFVKLLDQRR